MSRALKYTREVLEPVIARCTSYAGVLRELGLKISGGSQSNIIHWVRHYRLPTDHFTSQGWLRGRRAKGKKQRLSWQQILVVMPGGSRPQHAELLRRALVESGVVYQCAVCGIDSWNGQKIVLEIDHRDGNRLNNMKPNLRFLCPNCHSQTDNYGSKNKSR
jgi:5-methylcytosine-specific restriction endonuclease McrA